jgi:hypothetical protein
VHGRRRSLTLLLPYPGGHLPHSRPASTRTSTHYFLLTSQKKGSRKMPLNLTKSATTVCKPSNTIASAIVCKLGGTIVPPSPPMHSNNLFKPRVSLNPHSSCSPCTDTHLKHCAANHISAGPMTQEPGQIMGSHLLCKLQCHAPTIPPSAVHIVLHTPPRVRLFKVLAGNA